VTATDDDVDTVGRVEALVDDLARSYVEHTQPQAMLLVGSGATGEIDGYSDVDLILYHDSVPAERTLETARATVGAERFEGTDWPGEGYSERYDVDGIHCQLGHALIGPWEREIAKVVDELDLDPRLLKQLMGLFEGRPLHGEDLIAGWRRRAAYTPRLQRAMIEKHWRFFPWWYYEDKLRRRDSTIWRYDVLVRSAYDLVGISPRSTASTSQPSSSSASARIWNDSTSRHLLSRIGWRALHRRRSRCDSRARAARRRDARTCGGATAGHRAVDRVGRVRDATGEP
jgi:hypothetical protein